jgi:hypothetical protein
MKNRNVINTITTALLASLRFAQPRKRSGLFRHQTEAIPEATRQREAQRS